MSWLYIRVPNFALAAISARFPEREAVVILERHQVKQANQIAIDTGISPGMPQHMIFALCDKVHLAERDPQAEDDLLNRIATCNYHYTPHIYIDAEIGGIVTNLRGCLNLFHGLANLHAKLHKELQAIYHHFHYGFAWSPLAARLCSFSDRPISEQAHRDQQRQWVASSDISKLPLSDELCTALQASGISRVEQLQNIPKDSLGRRFGRPLLQVLEQLDNGDTCSLPSFTSRQAFSEGVFFNGEVTDKNQLSAFLAPLLSELYTYLREHQLSCQGVNWRIVFSNKHRDNIALNLPAQAPLQSALELSQLALERYQIPSRLHTESIDALLLTSQKFMPLSKTANELFPEIAQTSQQESALAHFLNKLQVQLEHPHYYFFQPGNSHLPEQYWKQNALLENTKTPLVSRQAPSWLLEPPQAIFSLKNTPQWHGQLKLLQGPERIDYQWWQQRQQRDYYIACNPRGQLCWIYYELIQQRWFLHGLFG